MRISFIRMLTTSDFPAWQSFKGTGRFRNMVTSSLRPAVVFEQGMYDPATLGSIMKIDTIARNPMMIVLFEDTLKPYIPTDTLVYSFGT
ncbi:MAG: hypothetical protein FJY10_03715 [Bacteroidetes bacterium]|nr:hypothetical protein [Bacteroidota bacterium]